MAATPLILNYEDMNHPITYLTQYTYIIYIHNILKEGEINDNYIIYFAPILTSHNYEF